MFGIDRVKDSKFMAMAAKEARVSRHVPYARHVNDTTIQTVDGILLSIIKLDGYCWQTADQVEVNQKLEIRNTLIRSLNDSRFAVWQHTIRRPIVPKLDGTFDDQFSDELNTRYMDALSQDETYINEIYLTVLRRGAVGRIGFADRISRLLRSNSAAQKRTDRDEAVDGLRKAVNGMVSKLEAYGARLLSVVERPAFDDPTTKRLFSEPCEFLTQLLNGGIPRLKLLTRQNLALNLPEKQIIFGTDAFELRGNVKADKRFGAMLSLRDYPTHSGPGLLDGLLRVTGSFTVAQSFALHDYAPVLSEVKRVERQIAGSDEAGTSVEADMIHAKNALTSRRSVLGSHHLTVACYGRTLKEMESCVEQVTRQLEALGCTIVREHMGQEGCFWAQLPGNFSYLARDAKITSVNFAGFASLHNFAVGQSQGLQWKTPISVLRSTSLTPYFYNFHINDRGNFTLNGQTGSGKTALMTFLIAQSARVKPKPRVFFFDATRGADVFIRAIGGQYEVLTPGKPTKFKPLRLKGSPEDREFLNTLLKFCCRSRKGGELSAEQELIVEEAVSQILELPVADRRWRDIPMLLRGRERAHEDDLASRFAVWLGARAWLFNNDDEAAVEGWEENSIFGYDLTEVLNDADIRTAALGYIFHRILGLLDGNPSMIFIDEGWKGLTDPKFVGFLTEALKTIRRKNGLVGFGTQSAKDIVESNIAHTIIEQSATNIFFPNAKADHKSYVEGFKLSEREFDWVLHTPVDSRQFLIKHGNESTIAKLDLSSMRDLLPVLSSGIKDVERCETLRQRYGEKPENWLPHYIKGEQ